MANYRTKLLRKIQRPVKNRGKKEQDKAAKELKEIYERSYHRVILKLHNAMKKQQWYTVARQRQVLKDIAKEMDKLTNNMYNYYSKTLKTLTKITTDEALKDVKGIERKYKKNKSFHMKHNRDITEVMLEDVFDHVASRTNKMKQQSKQFLRDKAQQVFRRASAEGISRKQASAEIQAEILKTDPNFTFVDRAGKRWDNKKYFEMLMRTVYSNTQNNIYMETLIQEGNDLVQVSFNGATDPCKKWEGKILSMTGQTEGYPTYQEAFETGEVFHPRCRHRVYAYHEEFEELLAES